MTFPAPRGTAPLAVAALLALPVLAGAQWLKYKTPGIPRTADGKPDLSAPAPRTTDGKPDFSSVWQNDNARAAETSKAKESMKPQPWAAALSKKRMEELGRDSPGITCLPPGPMVELGVGRVIQARNLLVMIFGALFTARSSWMAARCPKSSVPIGWGIR